MIFNEILILLGLKGLSSSEMMWMLIGLAGQLVFFSRWVIQWFVSEKYSKPQQLQSQAKKEDKSSSSASSTRHSRKSSSNNNNTWHRTELSA